MKYRKKPLIVEAYQWQPEMKDAPGVRYVQANTVDLSKTRGIIVDRPKRHVIDTQSGEVALEAGDWVIKGIAGEYYPCKPDIFAATYDIAGEGDGTISFHEDSDVGRARALAGLPLTIPMKPEAARTIEGTKLVLGPNLKQWLQKTATWGALVKEQEATCSKRFLLNIIKDLTAMAGDILLTEKEITNE